MLSRRVLCDGPITRPEDSYHVFILQTEHYLKSLDRRRPRSNMASAAINMTYEGWNFNSGNYLFTTDTK